MKNSDIFLISAQNIDCRYSLEPPRYKSGVYGGQNYIGMFSWWTPLLYSKTGVYRGIYYYFCSNLTPQEHLFPVWPAKPTHVNW